MLDDKNCKDCIYYLDTQGGFEGLCKRHAPMLPLVVSMDTYKDYYGKWPQIAGDDGCGDFEAKDK